MKRQRDRRLSRRHGWQREAESVLHAVPLCRHASGYAIPHARVRLAPHPAPAARDDRQDADGDERARQDRAAARRAQPLEGGGARGAEPPPIERRFKIARPDDGAQRLDRARAQSAAVGLAVDLQHVVAPLRGERVGGDVGYLVDVHPDDALLVVPVGLRVVRTQDAVAAVLRARARNDGPRDVARHLHLRGAVVVGRGRILCAGVRAFRAPSASAARLQAALSARFEVGERAPLLVPSHAWLTCSGAEKILGVGRAAVSVLVHPALSVRALVVVVPLESVAAAAARAASSGRVVPVVGEGLESPPILVPVLAVTT
mmetsp:Transcript_22109/g.58947  ORF Transcript_22109/g.58947 Transcript_22109/m.58947 type:complete len:316 (-) Transcript_22109:56-1003(-)